MDEMSAKPKLSPHNHTAHYLEHRQTSYGGLLFVLVLIGTLLAGATSASLAQDITVQAVVAGKAPTNAPVITVPASGQHFSTIPISVRGTCDAGLLVNLYRNDVLSGAALCDQGGHFNLQSDLFIGQNSLVARMYNAGNQPSPDSAAVLAYYDLPTTPVNLIDGSGSGTNGNVILTAQSIYKGTLPGQSLTWPVEILGGVAPYAVSIDWGDGTTDLISRPQPGTFTISHTYKQAGGFKGGYVMNLKAVDGQGTIATLQLAAIVNNAVGTPITGSLSPGGSTWWRLLVAWPLWVIALLMVISFGLGEWREKQKGKRSVFPSAPIAST